MENMAEQNKLFMPFIKFFRENEVWKITGYPYISTHVYSNEGKEAA